MTAFYLVMLISLVLILGLWNRVEDLKTAYLQALLFLEVMNWYDGLAPSGSCRGSTFPTPRPGPRCSGSSWSCP